MANIKPITDIVNGVFVKINDTDYLHIESGKIYSQGSIIDLLSIPNLDNKWFDIVNNTTSSITLPVTPTKIIDVIYNKSIHLRENVDFTISGTVISFSNGNLDTSDTVFVVYTY